MYARVHSRAVAGVLPLLCVVACGSAPRGAGAEATSTDPQLGGDPTPGDPGPVPSGASQDVTSPDCTAPAWQPTLPDNTSAISWGASVTRHGCVFTVGEAELSPPYPPTAMAFVERAPGPSAPTWCTAGYASVGTSAQGGMYPLIDADHSVPLLVVAFEYRLTPSGEAHTHVGLASLSGVTGVVLRRTGLTAMPTNPFNGNVLADTLQLDPAGAVIIDGTKDSVLPGESGAGTSYAATWAGFLSGSGDGAAPTSVVAY